MRTTQTVWHNITPQTLVRLAKRHNELRYAIDAFGNLHAAVSRRHVHYHMFQPDWEGDRAGYLGAICCYIGVTEDTEQLMHYISYYNTPDDWHEYYKFDREDREYFKHPLLAEITKRGAALANREVSFKYIPNERF